MSCGIEVFSIDGYPVDIGYPDWFRIRLTEEMEEYLHNRRSQLQENMVLLLNANSVLNIPDGTKKVRHLYLKSSARLCSDQTPIGSEYYYGRIRHYCTPTRA